MSSAPKRVISLRLSATAIAAIEERVERQRIDQRGRDWAGRGGYRGRYARRNPSASSYIRDLIAKDLGLRQSQV